MHYGTVNQCGEMRRNNKFYFGKVITSVLGDACGHMDVPGRQLLHTGYGTQESSQGWR